MTIKEKKKVNSILFFASKSGGRIDRLKLMKLLWLSDRIHLNKYGRLILKDDYNALPHGLVPSNTMDITKKTLDDYFDVEKYEIIAKSTFESGCFSESDIEIMEQVWEQYGKKMDGLQLRDFSHNFPEWLRFEKELNNPILPKSYAIVIDDFFCAPINKVDYPHSLDESNKSKEYFHVHSAIQSFLSK